MYVRMHGKGRGASTMIGWDSSRYVFRDRTTKDGLACYVADGDTVLVLFADEWDVLVITQRGVGWMYASSLRMDMFYEQV